MSCRAELKAGAWIANGVKKLITNGPEASVLIVYMPTAPLEAGSRSISAFIVEDGLRGFRKGERTDKLGMRGSIPVSWCSRTCHCRGNRAR